MRHNKEENHSLFNEGVTKIVFKYQKKSSILLYSGHLFLCSPVNKKKSPKTSHHRNSNHVYSRDLSLIFIKNISTFSFLRHHQTKSTDIHATMKGAHKKNCRKSSWNDADVSTKKTIEKNFLFIGNFLCVHIPITPFINWMWQWWQQTCSG